MTKREINKICKRVCGSEKQCPVYGAMRWFAGTRVVVLCDCNSGKGKCPLREALELNAFEEKHAKKSPYFRGGQRPCALCKRDKRHCSSCKSGWNQRKIRQRLKTLQKRKEI